MAGFDMTSTIESNILYGIPIISTMSHAYVTSYSSLDEIEEFIINDVKIKERTIFYLE